MVPFLGYITTVYQGLVKEYFQQFIGTCKEICLKAKLLNKANAKSRL